MSETPVQADLLAYYEHHVLPALFQRLDQAFPEMEWTWTGDGWKGVKKAENGYYNRFDQTAVVCNHPWGFVTRAGSATSWLAYVNGGVMPSGADLEHAVRKLADLAGVDHSWAAVEKAKNEQTAPTAPVYQTTETYVPPVAPAPTAPRSQYFHTTIQPQSFTTTPPESVQPFEPTAADAAAPVPCSHGRQPEDCAICTPHYRATESSWDHPPATEPYFTAPHDRQLDLWEAFVAFCHGCLCSQRYETVQQQLQEKHGIDCLRAEHLPLGIYPDAHTVAEYLRSQGFTDEEIDHSCVTADSRLAGRVIIPWRDSLGRIATIIGEDLEADEQSQTRRLYVKGGGRPAVFGLDIALRPSSCGVEHLLLVDSPLAVVYFHQHGIPNAAMIAEASRTPSKQDWEILADLGVETVTLAIGDDAHAAARTCKSLLEACHAEASPQVFAVAFGSLETCRTPADYSRLHGVARFRELLSGRQHIFTYLGAALVRRHRPGRRFTQAAVKALLKEAIALDASVYQASREQALDKFLWGEVLEATSVRWEDIRTRLTHRPHHAPQPERQTWLIEEEPRRWSRWHRTRAAHDLDWVNGLLQVAAEENADLADFQWPPRPRYVAPAPRIVRPRPQYAEPAYDYDDIRTRAYHLWEQKGRPIGHEQQIWYEAEQSLKRTTRAAGNGVHVA